MNIFTIDPCPILSANLPDKLVVKMVLETAQMLSSAVRMRGIEDVNLYKVSHLNHPCSIWARKTRDNFYWLVEHGLALAEQYSERYGKTHKSEEIINLAYSYSDSIHLGSLTPFAVAMPDEYKCTDVHQAYRNYMTSKPYYVNGWAKLDNKPNYPEWNT